MNHAQLQKSLSELVGNFGYDVVRKALRDAQPTTDKHEPAVRRVNGAQHPDAKRVRPTAMEIVASINVADDEKQALLLTLAKKYEEKEFMPNVNHVRDFLCNDRDVSRIKSRQQVTSAVFKKLANLETANLREIMERGLYGPTKRLADYARAIEGFERRT